MFSFFQRVCKYQLLRQVGSHPKISKDGYQVEHFVDATPQAWGQSIEQAPTSLNIQAEIIRVAE